MTIPISNANASYINSLVANAQNNIKTEKELQAKLTKAPEPSVNTPVNKKTDNSTFYKGMAALAVGGTLLIQGISLINRPNKVQGADVAKMSETIGKMLEDIGKLQKAIDGISSEQSKMQDKVSTIDLAEIQKQLKELAKAVKEGKINETQFLQKIQNIIGGNNVKLTASLEEIIKKYTEQITSKLASLKGIEEGLGEIKKHLMTPSCDVSKELGEIKATLANLQAPKELLSEISALKALLEGQGQKGNSAKDLSKLGAKAQEMESLRKILAELSEIKTLLSKIKPSEASSEDLTEIKALLQKLNMLDEVSKKLGEIKLDSDTILQKLTLLGEDVAQRAKSQQEGITEIKSAILRMLNGNISAPKATQIAGEAATVDIDVDLIAKVISSQIYDSAGIEKIQIDYKELIELLKDKTYGQNFEYIAAKFDELVDSIQELNSTKPQQRLGEAFARLQELLAKAKKEKALTTDAIFKSFFTPIEQIDFAKGEARIKATGEKFSGTVVSFEKIRTIDSEFLEPTGNRFLITYADGRIVRSTKYDIKGNEIFKKVYSYDVVPLRDSTEFHTKVKRIGIGLDGKKEMSTFQNIDTRSDSDGSLIRKRFNKMMIDYKERKANEITRYNEEFGKKTLYRETPEGNFVRIIGKDKKVHTIDYAAPFEKFNKNVNGLATSYIKVLSDEELSEAKKPGFFARLFSGN